MVFPQAPAFQADPNCRRSFYLPRLQRVFYRGDAVVHWEQTLAHRDTGWLDEHFHREFRELILHANCREGLLCPVYCLMPDHIHLVWMGLRTDSDQLNAMAFLRRYIKPVLQNYPLQHQPFDHVLQEEERLRNAFAQTCSYILENPVRAGIVGRREQWKYSGAIIAGYPTLHPLQNDFWAKFWKLYRALKDPSASKLRRPFRALS